jgi:hypothetical protein
LPSRRKDRGKSYDGYGSADDGYGHPGGDFSAGIPSEVVSQEQPKGKLEAMNYQQFTSRLKGPGTQ